MKQVPYKGNPIRLSADFLRSNFTGQKGMAGSIEGSKRKESTT